MWIKQSFSLADRHALFFIKTNYMIEIKPAMEDFEVRQYKSEIKTNVP